MTSLHSFTPGSIIFGHINRTIDDRGKTTTDRELPPRNTVLGLVSRSKDHKIFTDMIYKSGLAGILSNPEASVTLFLVPDKELVKLAETLYATLNRVDIQEFIGFHIVKGGIPIGHMMGANSIVETYHPREKLMINGYGLSPQVGNTNYTGAMVPTATTQANIITRTSNVVVGRSVIHMINLPLTPIV
jgi:hypothetical protein